MKRKVFFLFLASLGMNLSAQITETATEAVKNMGLGWNLGNTLDAHSSPGVDFSNVGYWGKQDVGSETCWGQPKAKPELFMMMRNAGFGAIRVPVTWYNHMDKDGKVDAAWMARVHEVVDYVIDNELYCIINVHHDTGADSGNSKHWIHADADNYASNKSKFEYLWTQIAEEFKDYGEKLLFEGYNEMLDKQSRWNEPGNAASYEALNNYAQSFVDAVRATGGNNETRNLIVCTYAAANGENAVKNLSLPTDPVQDHTIVEVHAYPNFFTWTSPAKLRTISQVKGDVDYIFRILNNYYVSKGIPAIVGEWGSYGVDNGAGKTDYDLRKDMFFEFCEYFIKKASEINVATYYWMGLTDGLNRVEPNFGQADLVELFAKTYHGEDFEGQYPQPEKKDVYECIDSPVTIGWGNPIVTISRDYLKSFDDQYQIVLSFTFNPSGSSDHIQLFDGNWSVKPSFYVNGTQYYKNENDPYQPHFTFEGKADELYTATLTFDKNVADNLKNTGIIIQGSNVTLHKVTLMAADPAAIESVATDASVADKIYDLSGKQVASPGRGFYIQGGKKLLLR